MKSFFGWLFLVVAFWCAVLFLGNVRCDTERQPYSSLSKSGQVGPNNEYGYSVFVRRFRDGSIQACPMLITRSDIPPAPISLAWRPDECYLEWNDTKVVEHRGVAVLLYEGRDKPLREIAASWDPHQIDNGEGFRKYVETLLVGAGLIEQEDGSK